MALWSYFIFLMFYLLPVGGSEVSDDIFPNNTSQKADDWLIVGQCRADCLNGFGLVFGKTTILICNQGETGCLACWQDCACDHFKPSPAWPQCSLPSTCFAGCRRAQEFFSRTETSAIKNGTLAATNASSSWTLLSSAKVFITGMVMVNNTLVDNLNRRYARKEHLVFSVGVFDGQGWSQLTQAVEFIAILNMGDMLPACTDGCRLRTVAMNGSSVLAVSFFSFVVQRTEVVAVNDTILAENSTLSVILPWKPDTAASNLTDYSYELFLTCSVSTPAVNLTNCRRTFNFHGNNQVPQYHLKDLFYNAVYNVTIVRSSPTLSTHYEYQFTTPGCSAVILGGLGCANGPSSILHPSSNVNVQYSYNAGIVGGVLAALACCAALYLILRCRMRKRVDDATSPTLSPTLADLRRWAAHAESLNSGPLRTQSETDMLLSPNFADITHGTNCSSTYQYLVTEGTFAGHHMALKRLGMCGEENEKKQLLTGLKQEITALTTLRQHSCFVRLLGTVQLPTGVCLLTKFEEHSWPLNFFLQKFYRSPQILKAESKRTGPSLTPGGFGAPGSGFLRNLTGTDMLAMAVQAASGLAYLNSRKIIHGAVCAANVLCNADFTVKIHGLSSVSYLDETDRRIQYSERYSRWLPLEVLKLRASGVGMKTDVWSFGVLVWEMLTLGSIPYTRSDVEWLIQFFEAGYRLEQSPLCSDEMYHFILECWTANVSSRPSMLAVHERIQAISLLKNHNLINLSAVGQLDSMVDVAHSYSSSRMDTDDLDDEVFSSDPRSISNENLVADYRSTPIGSLQRMKNRIGSIRSGVASSLNTGRSQY